jgi:choice-of-anchor C domain-containing protein
MSLQRCFFVLALAVNLWAATVQVSGAPPSPLKMKLLIVARNADHKTLQPFVAHKKKLLPTEVVSLESVLKDTKGADDAEKLKRYLYDRWKKGDVGYVLLVGDPEFMPVRYAAISLIDDKDKSEYIAFAASDLYFADLAKRDGTFDDWNGNKEGVNAQYYGQLKGLDLKGTINFDGIDYIPDVAVGRWPIHTTQQLKAVIVKTIGYENNVLAGNFPPIRRTEFVLGNGFEGYRQPMKNWVKQCEAQLGQPSVIRASQPEGKPDASQPIRDEVARDINSGVGMLFHSGHGNPSHWAFCLEVEQLKTLQSAKLPPVVFSAGCDTAAFAPDPPSEPWVDIHGKEHAGTNHKEPRVAFPPAPSNYQRGKFAKTSLGVEFVRSENGCVAYIGGAVGTQPGLALPMMAGFIDYTTQHGTPRIGDAWNWGIIRLYHDMNIAKLQPTNWVQNAIFHQGMKFQLFGDPSMRLPGRSKSVAQERSRDAAQPNLIVNGSFEDGLDLRYDGDMGLPSGSADLRGWKVINPVRLSGIDWENADGNRSIFFPGKNPRAGIEQSFPTTKGKRYRVSFALSANPNNGRWTPDLTTTAIEVRAAGKSEKFTFDCTDKMPFDMGWVTKEWEFEAVDAKTTLAFAIAETNGNYWRGPVLDDVRVVALGDGKTPTPTKRK